MDYHADRFEDFSWLMMKDGELAGLLPANRRDGVAHSHQGLTFGGLVMGEIRTLEALEGLDRWREACRGAGLEAIVYKPVPHIYHRRPSEEALFWLHRNGAELVRREVSSAIRLQSPGPWSSRRVRGVRRASGAGATFQRSQRWAAFWPVLTEVLGRRHDVAPVHSLGEIQRLASQFPEEIHLHTVELRGEVVAGTVIFRSPEVAHAQYIASSEQGREIGALDGLNAWMLDHYRGQVGYFDFGVSNERATGDLNAGLASHKDEFGGSAVVYDAYRLRL
jgi:hypothetical protein